MSAADADPTAWMQWRNEWTTGDPDSRPFGSATGMVLASLSYLLTISIVSYLMRNRRASATSKERPFNVFYVSVVHNIIMTIYSAYAMIGTSITFWHNWKSAGFTLLLPICDPDRLLYKNMDYWLYTFYLSKFYEIVDTLLLVLRAKPVFPPRNAQYTLHIFHHCITASIVWLAWRYPFSSTWFGPITNGFVHTFMYGYYLLTDLGMSRRWGGILITPIQIVQFVVCIASAFPEPIFASVCKPISVPSMFYTFLCYATFLCFFIVLWNQKRQARLQMKKQGKNTIKIEPDSAKMAKAA